jgi:hypothetical protein
LTLSRRHVRLLASEKALILVKAAAGVTMKELAAEYKVSTKTIQRVLAEPTEKTLRGEGTSEIAAWEAQAQAAGQALDMGVAPPPLPVRPDYRVPGVALAPLNIPISGATFATLHSSIVAEVQRLVPLAAQDEGAREALKALEGWGKLTVAVRLAMMTWGANFDADATAEPATNVRPDGVDPSLRTAGGAIETQGETLDYPDP